MTKASRLAMVRRAGRRAIVRTCGELARQRFEASEYNLRKAPLDGATRTGEVGVEPEACSTVGGVKLTPRVEPRWGEADASAARY